MRNLDHQAPCKGGSQGGLSCPGWYVHVARLSKKPQCFHFGELTYSKINCLHAQENPF